MMASNEPTSAGSAFQMELAGGGGGALGGAVGCCALINEGLASTVTTNSTGAGVMWHSCMWLNFDTSTRVLVEDRATARMKAKAATQPPGSRFTSLAPIRTPVPTPMPNPIAVPAPTIGRSHTTGAAIRAAPIPATIGAIGV